MTKSVYVIGGPGTGKSTFMSELTREMDFGPLEDLDRTPNAAGMMITLRGHRIPYDGVYIGLLRDDYPGTDGLDRASSLPGEKWLNGDDLPRYIVGEGATLSNRRWLTALHSRTDLLLVHLYADEFVRELRYAERGSTQASTFTAGGVTRAANLLRDMGELDVQSISVNTADNSEWDLALGLCWQHLEITSGDR